MYSFVDLGLIVLFALSLTAVYFAFEKIITFRALSFLHVRKYIIDTVTGVFFGLFTILFKVILCSLDDDFTIPLYFIIGIVFVIVRNINTAAPAFIISLIFSVFQNDFANIDYFIIGFYAAIVTVKLAVEFYTNDKWANLSVVVGVSLMGIVGVAIIGSAFEYSYGRVTYENSLLLSVATALVYYPFRTAVRFSISANLLFESVNYIFSRYYRSSLMQGAIGSYIAQNKNDKAIFALFEMKIDGTKDSDERTEVVETILTKVEKYFDERTTLFSYDQNVYGFFMPFKEEVKLKDVIDGNKTHHDKDVLDNIMGLIENVSGSYETTAHTVVNVDIKIGTSLYGVQSNSILRLERNALSALSQIDWESDNKVINFSFNKYRNKLKDSSRLSLMDENLDLNNFSNRYKPLLNIEGTYVGIQYVSVENNSDYELVQDVDELVRMNRWKYTFDRYFASEAISKNKDIEDVLMFEYSQILNQNIDEYQEFKEKLSKSKISLDRIIPVLSIKDINKNNIKKIDRLKNDGIKWAITGWKNASEINKLDPDYAIINNENIAESDEVKAITVSPSIRTEPELIEMLKVGIDLLGGSVMQDKSSVKKPSKQSKIYIEDLIKSIEGEN